MRFLCLHHGDIRSEQTFSGIPLHIMNALESLGHQLVVEGNLQPGAPLIGRIKGVLYKKLLRKTYLVNRDPHTFRRRAVDANRRIRAAGKVDAVVITQIGDAAYIESEAPMITVHDATWFQLLDYYPGYERKSYAKETIDGGIALDKLGLQRSAHCIFTSQWAARSAELDYGIPQSKLSIAPPGANLPRVPTAEECARYRAQRGSGPCRFLFLGREWYRKGGDIAVAVLQVLQQRGMEVELHVVGCEPQGAMPSFVTAHGKLWKTDPEQAGQLDALFQKCDFFILPTRAECFCVVFSEAAAFGLPVVTTDTGGVAEGVTPDWGLALAPDARPNLFADWIEKQFHDRSSYEKLGQAARASFDARLNWEAMGRHIVSVTRQLQHGKTSPSTS